jgi:hypothetical protein
MNESLDNKKNTLYNERIEALNKLDEKIFYNENLEKFTLKLVYIN